MEQTFLDWLQIIFSGGSFIATLAGLYYVAATLKEQARVNNAQFELLRIESNRAAREVKPEAKIELASSNGSPAGSTTGGFVEWIYSLQFDDNKATNVCFEYISLPGASTRYSDNLAPGKNLGTMYPGKPQQFVITQEAFEYPAITLRVHYFDVDGRHLQDEFVLEFGRVELRGITTNNPYPGYNKVTSQGGLMRPIWRRVGDDAILSNYNRQLRDVVWENY